jgi:hypothetical protein
MKRRTFIKKTSAGFLGFGMIPGIFRNGYGNVGDKKSEPVCVTTVENQVRFFTEAVTKSLNVAFIADTHLHHYDDRELPYKKYSDRMAGAYNQTRHFRSGELTNPEECFDQTLKHAVESESDLIVLGGDIFSFPSEAAIEWAYNKLEDAGIPYLFVAGNHDWHYEGMEGSLEDLRAKWIEKRLLPLYHGKNPMMSFTDVKGMRFLAIDNSTYQISDEQLQFFRKQVQSGMPLVLVMHIPLYAPGRSVSYGCGHPDWGAETDKNYKLERRPRWPEGGHTKTTMNFHEEVFSASNLLGVFTGHIHRQSMEMTSGKPQFVSDDNASGAFLDVRFMPYSLADHGIL